jgi:hypothetical protein
VDFHCRFLLTPIILIFKLTTGGGGLSRSPKSGTDGADSDVQLCNSDYLTIVLYKYIFELWHATRTFCAPHLDELWGMIYTVDPFISPCAYIKLHRHNQPLLIQPTLKIEDYTS